MIEPTKTINELINKHIHPITGYMTRQRREERMRSAKELFEKKNKFGIVEESE